MRRAAEYAESAYLLEKFAPAVILLDETVAYIRQLEAGKSYAGGTFNSNLSFLQALTEAVSRVPNAMLLASLPESAMEVGDAQGQAARSMEHLVKQTGGRVKQTGRLVQQTGRLVQQSGGLVLQTGGWFSRAEGWSCRPDRWSCRRGDRSC